MCQTMKIVVIFSTVLLFIQISAQPAKEVNCLWPKEIDASEATFTISASKEVLKRSYSSHTSSGAVCSTQVDVSSSAPVYYELEVSTQNAVMTDCNEGYSLPEYLSIVSTNASVNGNGIEACLAHLDRIVVQLPQRISFMSERSPQYEFDIKFTRVSSPCLLDKLEASADHKFLFSPLYDLYYSTALISCKVIITVPRENVLFVQIRRSPSPTLHQCSGSLVVSGTSSHNQELCGSGLKAVVLEPRNYAEGISFNFDRERNKYFSEFQLEYWAIQRVVKDCRNLSSDVLSISSKAVSYELQVSVEAIERGYCDFHLSTVRKTLSLLYLSDVPRHLSVDISTGEDSSTEGCGFTNINRIHAPPNQDISIRIRPCPQTSLRPNSLLSLIVVAVAEDNDSFPKVFYAANDNESYVWIPEVLTRKAESLTFAVKAESDKSCVMIAAKPFHLSLSEVANLFAGIGTDSFDFSRDCSDKAQRRIPLYSNTSDTVTVQIKRNINEGFWLIFQVFTGGDCPLMETELDQLHELRGTFLPPVQDRWRENTQCKWIIHASQDNALRYRGHNLNPEFVVLEVRNATTQQLITTFPPSASRGWYYAMSDIEVYAHVSKSLTKEESFDFQYDQQDFSDIEVCSPHTTHQLTRPTTVYTPNYPNYSFGSSQCKWLLRQQQPNSLISVEFTPLSSLPCGPKSSISITFNGITKNICDPSEVEESYHGDVLIQLVTSADEPVPGFYFSVSFIRDDCPNRPAQLTAASYPRSITSPGYPLCYSDDLDCFWSITASTGMTIEIIIIDLVIESSTNCEWDGLQIFDGPSDIYPSLASLCGQNVQNRVRFFSSSSELSMRFYSDSRICHKGFNLTYEEIHFSHQACSRNPVTLVADETFTHLQSPGYPFGYLNNLQCSWIIKSSLDRVQIYVMEVNLQEHPLCHYDYVEIYDGEDRFARRLARLCRQDHYHRQYESTSDLVLIYFRSDSHSSGGGFHLSFKSISTEKDDHSSKISQTGTIVGGNIAGILVIFCLIVGYVLIVQRRRRRQSQRHRRSSNTTSGTYSNSQRSPSSVFVINPLILNNYRGRSSLSNEPPPYPGLTNEAYSEELDPGYNMLGNPPEYSEVANTYQSLQPPPAYSADSSTGTASNSDDQPRVSNSAESPNVENDERSPEEVNNNGNDGEEYVELQDTPPEYELARQIEDEPPPAYEPRANASHQRRQLGPF